MSIDKKIIRNKKIGESKKGVSSKTKGVSRKTVICPHCGKSGGIGVMNR